MMNCFSSYSRGLSNKLSNYPLLQDPGLEIKIAAGGKPLAYKSPPDSTKSPDGNYQDNVTTPQPTLACLSTSEYDASAVPRAYSKAITFIAVSNCRLQRLHSSYLDNYVSLWWVSAAERGSWQ